MKINFAQQILNMDGTPLMRDEKSKELALLSHICIEALLKNESVPTVEKVLRFGLAQKIHAAKGTLDLKSEDIVLIKKLVGEVFPPLIVGRAFSLMDC